MKYLKSLFSITVLALAGTVVSHAQNLYVVNQTPNGSHYVTTFDSNGNFLGVLATNTGAQGIAVDQTGNFYVASGIGDGKVAKYAADGTLINAAYITAQYYGIIPLQPFGLTIDTNGDLFVSDLSYGFVQKYDTNGSLINSDFFQTGRSAFAMALGSNGNLYVSDLNNSTLYQVSAAGADLKQIPTPTNPNGVAVDKNGYVYVALPSSGLVAKYDANLNSVSNFVSGLNNPYGLVFDNGGNLYVSDFYTNIIYKYDANGNLLNTITNTFLSRPGFMAMGPATAAPLLGITTLAASPVVIWPASATNYVLQMSTDLASTNWVTITNGAPFVGVMVTNAPANAFFRLQKTN